MHFSTTIWRSSSLSTYLPFFTFQQRDQYIATLLFIHSRVADQ